MKVQARLVDSRRHTIGWKIGNQWRNRKEAVSLVMNGKVEDVMIRKGSNDEKHIVSSPSSTTRLYDLPTKIERSGKISVMRAAKR
jgi:hypothetical protein